jgi:DNA-binding NarL/FixJ family response regulator
VTTIVIADDQELVRTGLRMILDAEPDLEVVAETADGPQTVAVVGRLRPDVVLMDIQMPLMDGIEATRRVVHNSSFGAAPRVLMLTTFDRSELVYNALLAGASGFLLKDMPGEQLVAGVRAVARGEEPLAPGITRRLIESFVQVAHATPPAGYDELTPRERDVLILVAQGLSNAEVAARLIVSEATVKTHVAHVLAKLRLRDRIQIVVLAYETGLIRPGAPGRLTGDEV